MKRILFFLCLLSASLTSAYADTELSMVTSKDLGWGAAKRLGNAVSFSSAWNSWGWDYSTITGEGESKDTTYTDFSSYDGYSAVVIKFTSNITVGRVNFNAVYGYTYIDDNGAVQNQSTGESVYFESAEADSITVHTVTITFNEDYYDKMYQINFNVCDKNYSGLPDVEETTDSVRVTIVSATLISKTLQPIVNVNNEAYINTYWDEIQKWNTVEGDTIVPSVDQYKTPGATITYTDTNGNGLGWGYYSSGNLDISAYKGIEVKYSVSYTGGTAPTVTLEMGSKTGSNNEHEINSVEGNSGIISFTFSSDTDFDPANVVKIVIKATAACTVTVDYIKLVSSTISTSAEDFITTTGEDGSKSYYLNLNVTKTGEWAGEVTDDSNNEASAKITTSKIKFAKAGENIGYEYTDKDNSSTHLNLTSYNSNEVTFTDMEVRYTISSTAARTEDKRLRVMLELMDDNWGNVEVYDTYSVGRIRVKFSDYTNMDLTKVKTVTFMLENLPDDESSPVLNIESIQLFTDGTIPALGSEPDTLLISQMYVNTNTSSSITPDNAGESIDKQGTVTSSGDWKMATWYFGDVSMDDYWGVEVEVSSSSKCAVRLEVEYANTIPSINNNCECISFHAEGSETTRKLLLPFIKNENISGGDNDIASDVHQIYLIWGRVTAADSAAMDAGDDIEFTVKNARLLQKEAYSSDYLTITVNTDEGYCTYYNETQAYKMPYGMQGSKITGIGSKDTNIGSDDDEYYTLTTNWEYARNEDKLEGGVTVPADMPLLLYGSEDQNVILSFTAFYADNSEEQSGGNAKRLAEENSNDENGSTTDDNMLHGSDTQTTPGTMKKITHTDIDGEDYTYSTGESDTATDVTDDDYYYYLFTYKTGTWSDTNNSYDNWPYSTLGFYWSSVYQGGPFYSNAHRAWLAIPYDTIENLRNPSDDTDNSGKTINFVIGDSSNSDDNLATDDNETTGIATIEAAATADGAIYNLQGIRVNSMSKPGIYIVGGRKVVKK